MARSAKYLLTPPRRSGAAIIRSLVTLHRSSSAGRTAQSVNGRTLKMSPTTLLFFIVAMATLGFADFATKQTSGRISPALGTLIYAANRGDPRAGLDDLDARSCASSGNTRRHHVGRADGARLRHLRRHSFLSLLAGREPLRRHTDHPPGRHRVRRLVGHSRPARTV